MRPLVKGLNVLLGTGMVNQGNTPIRSGEDLPFTGDGCPVLRPVTRPLFLAGG